MLHTLFFQEVPACTCAVAHVVNLQLQNFIYDEQSRNTGVLRFKIIFSSDRKTIMISRLPWDSQEVEMQLDEAAEATAAVETTTATSSLSSQVLESVGPELAVSLQTKRDQFKRKLRNALSLFDFRERDPVSKTSARHSAKLELSQIGSGASATM
jgi:hypothetical protein